MGLSRRLGALYAGRHLRTTMVLGLASAAAGVLTGAVGIGVAGTPAGHQTPANTRPAKAVKAHHPATTAPVRVIRPRATSSRTTSPSPTVTPTPKPTVSTQPTSSSPPPTSAPPTSAPPTGSGTAPPSASPPG